MNLRQKAILIIPLITIVLFAVFCFTSRALVLSSFTTLEQNDAKANMKRALYAVYTDANQLENVASDYAVWDDTYQFVVKPHPNGIQNSAYIQSNYVDTTYSSLRVNLIAIFKNDDSLLYGKMFDASTGQQPLPDWMRSLLKAPRFSLMVHHGVKDWHEGVVMLPQGPMLVVSLPIVTSNMQGPSHGTMVFGRILDNTEWDLLSRQSGLPLQALPLTQMVNPVGTVSSQSGQAIPFASLDASKDLLNAFVEYPDISGRAAFVLKFSEQRTIYQQGVEMLTYFEVFLLALSIVYAVCTLLFLDWAVLRRITRFVHRIRDIDDEPNDKMVVDVDSKDELGELQRAFNALMVRLRESRRRIWHQAYHDSLTGLANRNKFYILIEDALRSMDRGNHGFAILFIDIDKFKPVNDKYGHDIGDMLLCSIAQRLEQAIGNHGVAVRLGGDEFLALWWEVKTEQEVETIRESVQSVMKEPHRLREDLVFQIDTSVGVGLFPKDGVTLDVLLQKADRDMYRRKHRCT